MKQRNYSWVFVIGVIGVILWLTREIPFCGWDFRDALWGPVSMLVQHQTPYTFNTPYGPYPGTWMPTLLGTFFYFGYLSCDIAAKIWLIIELAGFIWIIWMIADYKMPPRWVFLICVTVFAFFPPLWLHVQLGQFSMLFVIAMMVVIYIPKSERFWPLLLVLGLTKPQLAVLIYPGLLVSVWHKKGFLQALKLVLLTAVCAGLVLIPLFLYYPGWVKDFLFVASDNLGVAWDLPTLFIQLPFIFGKGGYLLWGFVAVVSMGVSLWFWYKKDPKIALLVSLAATPMVTTYASSWDFMLLMPGFFWLIIKLKSKIARSALILGMALLFIIQITLRWQRDYPDGRQWWIPPVLILVYLISLGIEYLAIVKKKARLQENSLS